MGAGRREVADRVDRFNEAPACLPGNPSARGPKRSAPAGFNEAPACLPGNVARNNVVVGAGEMLQ